MGIADQRFFSKHHIDTHHFNASPVLAEQAIHCLELVSELVEAGLSFQFKGGNSLLLVLPDPQRFSIDVDIATDCSREEIETALDVLIKRFSVFTRWEKRQHKTKPWLPISSYFVYYKSQFLSPAETSIMLDAQLRRSPYATEQKPVCCGELYKSNICAEIPLPSSIIGDKLLTLGPATLGIPVGKGKEAQRLKHVFDVSRLVKTKPSIAAVRKSFNACIQHELEIQNRSITGNAVVTDTLQFCFSVAGHDAPQEINEQMSPVLIENVKGLPGFSEHLFRPGYSWTDLQHDMIHAAVCVAGVGNASLSDEQFLITMHDLSGAVTRKQNSHQLFAPFRNVIQQWGYNQF